MPQGSKISRQIRRLTLLSSMLVTLVVATLIVNYGVCQAYAEYRLKNIAVAQLSHSGEVDPEDLATILGIAHKESRFWNGAVGRHHEVGVMQLTESLAREHGLKILASTKKSSPVQKLLFLSPSESERDKDQRFDETVSMRVAIEHFVGLKARFRTRDGLDEATARDLAVLAFHVGETRTRIMLERIPRRDLNAILDSLADPTLPRDTWFERAVAISFAEHVLRYRSVYLARVSDALPRQRPTFTELFMNILATPREFHTRLFGDIPELERAMRERGGSVNNATGTEARNGGHAGFSSSMGLSKKDEVRRP